MNINNGQEVTITKFELTACDITHLPQRRSMVAINQEPQRIHGVKASISHKEALRKAQQIPQVDILNFDEDRYIHKFALRHFGLSDAKGPADVSVTEEEWAQNRFSFELHVETKYPGDIGVSKDILIGYALGLEDVILEDNKVVGLMGSPRFIINHVINTASSCYQDADGLGYQEIIKHASEVITNPKFAGMDAPINTQRAYITPAAVAGRQSVREVLEGLKSGGVVYDTRHTLTEIPRFSYTKNIDPAHYLVSFLNSLLNAKNADHDFTRLIASRNEMIAMSLKEMPVARSVLRALTAYKTGMLSNQFEMADLRAFSPDLQIELARTKPADIREFTNPWKYNDELTKTAAMIVNLATSCMTLNGWCEMEIEVSENGPVQKNSYQFESLNDSITGWGSDPQRAASILITQIQFLPFIRSLAKGKKWSVRITGSLVRGLWVIIDQGDGREQMFAAPVYASASYSPMLGDEEALDQLADAFDILEDELLRD